MPLFFFILDLQELGQGNSLVLRNGNGAQAGQAFLLEAETIELDQAFPANPFSP